MFYLAKNIQMKQTPLYLNIILLLAVGVLFYLHFSGKPKENKKNESASVLGNKNSGGVSIAYLDLDSLNENVSFIKKKRKELEAEQLTIETEWENGYRNLENQKNNFLKKGNAITQEEAQNFQASLIAQQQQIDGKKQSLTQKLNDKSVSLMGNIQKQLKSFLEEYNKEKKYSYILTTGNGLDYIIYKEPSLNITDDVIEGMNAKTIESDNP